MKHSPESLHMLITVYVFAQPCVHVGVVHGCSFLQARLTHVSIIDSLYSPFSGAHYPEE